MSKEFQLIDERIEEAFFKMNRQERRIKELEDTTEIITENSEVEESISDDTVPEERNYAMLPFTVFYNQEDDSLSEAFYIYVPKGCLMVDEEDVEFESAINDCVEVEGFESVPDVLEDASTEEKAKTVYAFVRVTKHSNGQVNDVSVKFKAVGDDEDVKEDEEPEWVPGEKKYKFIVGRFDESYTRICTSQVCLGNKKNLYTSFTVFGSDGEWKVRFYYQQSFTYAGVGATSIIPSYYNDIVTVDTGDTKKGIDIWAWGKLEKDDSGAILDCSLEFGITPKWEEEPDYSFMVASITDDGEVQQVVHGAVHMGGEGGVVESTNTPFRYVVKKDEEGKIVERKVVDNTFYFDGNKIELEDFVLPEERGNVYLRVERYTLENEKTPNWNFSLTTSNESSDSEDALVKYILLYEIEDSKVLMDHRTSFLTVSVPPKELPYQELAVVTDVYYEDSEGMPVLKIKKKKIKGFFELSNEEEEQEGGEEYEKLVSKMVKIHYMENVYYDESDYTLKGKFNWMYVPESTINPGGYEENTIFKTTPISLDNTGDSGSEGSGSEN